jgi:hypothetical protein
MSIVDRFDVLEVFELLIKLFDLLILLSPEVMMNQLNLMFNPDAVLDVFFYIRINLQNNIFTLTFSNMLL